MQAVEEAPECLLFFQNFYETLKSLTYPSKQNPIDETDLVGVTLR
jgi:hypothetical protein